MQRLRVTHTSSIIKNFIRSNRKKKKSEIIMRTNVHNISYDR